jgi:hypothetical protein
MWSDGRRAGGVGAASPAFRAGPLLWSVRGLAAPSFAPIDEAPGQGRGPAREREPCQHAIPIAKAGEEGGAEKGELGQIAQDGGFLQWPGTGRHYRARPLAPR